MDSMITIRNGSKSYGNGKNALLVVDNFNMTINKGSIYGFLGPSGCGKSTVLSILVGQRKLDSGELTVDGGRSNSLNGKKVGYMPQDHCLFGFLNISETFYYYGRIYSLDKSEIKTRMENLLNFLDLENIKSCIINLSGGQKRRVSMGVALIHSPDILILDEPTVGVDPLLRGKIWQYLTNLSKKENTTVLITTHFIEEARQADAIGFMRSGRLLAEGKPVELMQSHGTISLEDVFINLCNQDNSGNMIDPKSSNESSLNGFIVERSSMDNLLTSTDESKNINKQWPVSKFISCSTIHALVVKNLLKLMRNPSVLIMMMFLPIIMVVSFCLAFRNEAYNIPFVIVNDELPYMLDNCPTYIQECELTNISCRILHHLTRKDTFDFRDSTDIKSVASQFNQGTISGYIYIHGNFSDMFFKRLLQPVDLDLDTINQSTMQVHLSQSSFPLTSVMQKNLIEGYFDFMDDLLNICEVSEELAELPINVIDEPQFDSENLPSIQDFLAPGIFVLTVFFLANELSGELFIEERLDGTYERSRVAGVQTLEILISYAITNFGILIVQTTTIIGLINGVFQFPYYGSLGLVFLITFLQGYNGLSYGFMLASIFTDHAQFNHMMLFTILPVMFLSGIWWTPYSMGTGFLRTFSNLMPLTMACQALRDVMTRGWDLSYSSVQWGIGSTLIWSLLSNVLTFVVVKIKSK